MRSRSSGRVKMEKENWRADPLVALTRIRRRQRFEKGEKKERMDRAQFVADAISEWNSLPEDEILVAECYLSRAASLILDQRNAQGCLTEEAVGVARLLRLMARMVEVRKAGEVVGPIRAGAEYSILRKILEA